MTPERPTKAASAHRHLSWPVVLAWFAALAPLPSTLWRLPLDFGHPMGFPPSFLAQLHVPGWGSAYVIALGVVSELLGLCCLGLVRPWGERWPSWIPRLDGRAIPTALVAGLALAEALALIAFAAGYVVTSLWDGASGPRGAAEVVMHLAYLPVLLWGPALLVLTVHYVTRQRANGALTP